VDTHPAREIPISDASRDAFRSAPFATITAGKVGFGRDSAKGAVCAGGRSASPGSALCS